jgi:hypothetical protein
MVGLGAAANEARNRCGVLATGIPLVCDLETALGKFGILREGLYRLPDGFEVDAIQVGVGVRLGHFNIVSVEMNLLAVNPKLLSANCCQQFSLTNAVSSSMS